MITMEKTHNDTQATPYSYWLDFCITWDNLANEAYDAGQTEMAEFFGELADDAGDVWAGIFGPLGK